LGPVKPKLQVQLMIVVQALHEAPESAGHASHVVATVAPNVDEYFPAAQLVQAAVPTTVL
jgi:hypothetical protein